MKKNQWIRHCEQVHREAISIFDFTIRDRHVSRHTICDGILAMTHAGRYQQHSGMKSLFCLLILLFSPQLAPAQMQARLAVDTAHKQFTIENCVNEFDPAKVESTKVGYQYWFVDRDFLDGRTVKMSVVAPHSATHPPHSHPEDEVFFILEGKAEFFLDGETKTAGPSTSFYCPSNSRHGIRNVGDTVLKYLVIKKYEQK